ncbi:MAG TPA: DNA repair protein RecO [bacterium]
MELIAGSAVLTAVAACNRDRLLTFVTRSHGGVRLFARRPAQRSPGTVYLDPLQGGELVFLLPGEGGRARLHSFVPQRVWPGIRADLGRTLQALAFLELVNATLTEGEPQAEVFDLLVRFLNRLEDAPRPGITRIAASLRLLALAGFTPSLSACAVCGGPADPRRGGQFAPDAGGIVCRDCLARERRRCLSLGAAALGFLQRAASLPEARLQRLRVPEAVEREASRALDTFVEACTGARPRCGAAIERVEAV